MAWADPSLFGSVFGFFHIPSRSFYVVTSALFALPPRSQAIQTDAIKILQHLSHTSKLSRAVRSSSLSQKDECILKGIGCGGSEKKFFRFCVPTSQPIYGFYLLLHSFTVLLRETCSPPMGSSSHPYSKHEKVMPFTLPAFSLWKKTGPRRQTGGRAPGETGLLRRGPWVPPSCWQSQ